MNELYYTVKVGWNGWIQIWLLVLIGIIALFTFLYIRRISRYRVGWILVRVAILLLLIFIALQPSYEKYRLERKNVTLAVVVDGSMSMKAGGRERLVISFLEHLKKSGLKSQLFVGGKGFIRVESPLKTLPGYPITDLKATFSGIAKTQKAYSAFVIVTDGRHTAGRKSEVLNVAGRNIVKPVVFVVPGEGEVDDMSISEVDDSPFAYADEPYTFYVNVRGYGRYSNSDGLLKVFEGSKLIETRNFEVKGGRGRVKVVLSPRGEGEHFYHIKIQGEDKVNDNNNAYIKVTATKRKVRVLHLAGRSSWDVRFLRKSLKEDPRLDLVTFIILRTREDVLFARDDELSLIPFPGKELFIDTIDSFDAIIFQNFPAYPYILYQYSRSMADSVMRNQGSFLFIGGAESLSRGGYFTSPIRPLIPVDFSRMSRYSEEAYRVELTDAGKSHFLTSFFALVEGGVYFQGLIENVKVKPECRVLARAQGNGVPVIVACEMSKWGPRLYIGTDTLWTLHAQSIEKKIAFDMYNEFIRRLVRWFSGHSSTSGRMPFIMDKNIYTEGDEVKVKFSLPHLSPWYLRILRVQGEGGGAVRELRIGDPNENVSLGSLPRGIYLLEVLDQASGEYFRKKFVYGEVSRELADITPDTSFIKALVRLSPHSRRMVSFKKAISQKPEDWLGEEVVYRKVKVASVPLWNFPAVFTLVFLLYAIDWVIRRKNGFA